MRQRPNSMLNIRALTIAALAIVGWLVNASATAAQLSIAAAADLKFALDDLVAEFRARHPSTDVTVSYGSSGNFYAQLRNRAPYDLYFSADIDYPRRLAAEGLALDDHVFRYAIGRIVVWVPSGSPIDVEALGIQALLAPSAHKIAVANPQHAPYGRAAIAALQSLEVHASVSPRLVYGENIAQTAQFVQSGAADIGIIALSLAVAPQLRDQGRFWEVPADAYPRMDQGGMITSWTQAPSAARELRDFVLGDHGRAVLRRYGFFLPEQ